MNISIVGTGNVATQLALAFQNTAINVTHIGGRSKQSSQELADKIGAQSSIIKDLPVDQITLVCVSDDAIADVLTIINAETPVAYTSGSVVIETLPIRDQLGVFYPLQTMTKTKVLDFAKVPFFIESDNEVFAATLIDLAKHISDTVSIASSAERAKLHVSAVFVNNFTNHILHHAKTFADANNMEFKHLLPLLQETIAKVETEAPYDIQTGPARRGDELTIQNQLNALDGDAKKIYTLLTESIQKTYKNND